MSSIEAEVAILETRVEALEDREESTRRRFDDHLAAAAVEQRAIAGALESIRFDVHEIRTGKKSILRLARAALVIIGLVGAAGVVATKWTLEHLLADWQTQHDPGAWRSIP